ncbi:MAG: TlpA family protein disulfide reductase [Chitinophagaceae bacterium]|nr:TlpA family protein disulfide reductase [Chitinophagaceae bacterium]
MKKIYFLILLAIVIDNNLSAQKNTIIQGKIWATQNDTITITHYPYKIGITSIGGITNKLITSTGKFSIQLPNYNHSYYLSIVSKKFGNLRLNDLFIEPGDSLMIENLFDDPANRKNPYLHITGRNADKNELQHIWDHANSYQKIKLPHILISGMDSNEVEAKEKRLQNYLTYKQYWDSLKEKKSYTLSPSFVKIFEKDLEVNYTGTLLGITTGSFDKIMKNTNYKDDLQKLNDKYKKMIEPAFINLFNGFNNQILSPQFLHLAVKKTMLDARLSTGREGTIPASEYLKSLEQWPTFCKQEITTALVAYVYSQGVNIDGENDFAESASKLIDKPQLRSIVKEFAENYKPGYTILPFTMTNANGGETSIRDLQDKVIVIDFWFTGCTACVMMSKVLREVKKSIGENKELVFMSISVDEEKEQWLKSVAMDIYTENDNINLYTNGEGIEHRLIKAYNIMGYPHLIIVGKNNKLISGKPPIPRNRSELINLENFIRKAIDN